MASRVTLKNQFHIIRQGTETTIELLAEANGFIDLIAAAENPPYDGYVYFEATYGNGAIGPFTLEQSGTTFLLRCNPVMGGFTHVCVLQMWLLNTETGLPEFVFEGQDGWVRIFVMAEALLAGNPISIPVRSNDINTKSQVLIEEFIYSGGTTVEVATLTQYTNAGKIGTFEISGVIKTYLEAPTVLDLQSYSFNEVKQLPALRIFNIHTTVFNEEPVTHSVTVSAINGRLEEAKYKAYPFNSWLSFGRTQGFRSMCTAPAGKPIYLNYPELLPFIGNNSYLYNAKVLTNLNCAGSSPILMESNPAGISPEGSYYQWIFTAFITQGNVVWADYRLGFTTEPSTTEAEEARILAQRPVMPVPYLGYQPTYIRFVNHLGFWENYLFLGQLIEEVEDNKTSIQLVTNLDDYRPGHVIKAEAPTYNYELSTGEAREDIIRWLAIELAQSSAVEIWDFDNDKATPIYVKEGKRITKQQAGLFTNLKISFTTDGPLF